MRGFFFFLGGGGTLPLGRIEVFRKENRYDESSENMDNICAFGLQELPLAVFKKPHCFCTWTSSLFSLNQQSDNQQCGGNPGLNYTSASTPTAPTDHDHYQVYHTPVLGEIFVV